MKSRAKTGLETDSAYNSDDVNAQEVYSSVLSSAAMPACTSWSRATRRETCHLHARHPTRGKVLRLSSFRSLTWRRSSCSRPLLRKTCNRLQEGVDATRHQRRLQWFDYREECFKADIDLPRVSCPFVKDQRLGICLRVPAMGGSFDLSGDYYSTNCVCNEVHTSHSSTTRCCYWPHSIHSHRRATSSASGRYCI
ncbi:hypothetical protein BC835DRAFT_1034571 [Cytidiella melzeri]|nr:hypothetical protein BC835DRAFT_1034571 [Cytidiella melzeri]